MRSTTSKLSRLGCLLACPLAFCVITGVMGLHSTSLQAQSVCIPLPRLLTTMPMGAQIGTEVEVVITGDNLDDAGELLFTHASIKARAKKDAGGAVEPNKYIVTVAADCPAGIYEARVMSRLGISSARVFSVDSLPELVRTTANTSLATAMEVPVGSIVNAVLTSKAIDHYRFTAKQGQRLLVYVAADTIDSKLSSVVVVGDAEGRDLQVQRRGGLVDFTAPADGQYTIKVHDLTFNGGPAYFYRLSLRELASDAALPVFPSTQSVSAFSWPPKGLSSLASAREAEPNNAHVQAQKVSLPCDISGSFYPAADVDTFEFTAKKGEVWWVEVASERLGRPTDPAIVVQHVSGTGDQATFTDLAELSDIPSPVKVSSNGYAYDGPPFNGGSSDILGRIEIQQDGVHHLQLRDLFGGTRKDPQNVYRLIIREAQPDFALVAWGLHMELRNGDRAALSKPVALRAGQTMALEVVVVRRDGFDGPIEMSMTDLPPGVTATGLTIPSGKSRGMMLVTADAGASPSLAIASFVGRATIGDKQVTREVRLAEMTWPVPDSWGEIPRPRLVSNTTVSVSSADAAPLTISPAEKKTYEVAAGEKLTIPVALTKRTDFSGSTIKLKTFGSGFEQAPAFDISLTGDKAEAMFDLAKLKVPAGDYTIALYGGAVAKYQDNPSAVLIAKSLQQKADEAVKRAEAEVMRLTGELASTSAEKKAELETALAAAKTSFESSKSAAKAAADRVTAATNRAAPKDTVDIIVSEPISIRVLAAGR